MKRTNKASPHTTLEVVFLRLKTGISIGPSPIPSPPDSCNVICSTAQHGTGLNPVKNLTLRYLVIIVRDLSAIHQISNLEIRELVTQRMDDLGGDAFDANALGYFLVVESGDAIEAINAQLGFDILCNRFTGIRYDQTGFTPSFEFVEAFPACYDMVFILSDDGYGVEVFVQNESGVLPDLLAMCQRYAVQGTT